MKIVFVVLHYENVDDTKICLSSLSKYLEYRNVYIVVVDNGSIKGKVEEIKKEYVHMKNIHYIYSDKNLGFAKGNNLGFIYAKYVLKAQIIILCNNDLIFKQGNFINVLEKIYETEKFDVAGPRIISLVDGKDQNPVPVLYNNINDINKRIVKHYILLLLCRWNLDLTFQKYFARNIQCSPESIKLNDFQLHGACLILANNYIELFDGLYSGTFMYEEESILKYIAKRNKMKMYYANELTVYHKEKGATESILGKGKKKRKFYYRWSLKSCLLLRKLMKEDLPQRKS